MKHQHRLLPPLILVLMVLALVATAAYALYKRMNDPGLPTSQAAVLAADRTITARPTLSPASTQSVTEVESPIDTPRPSPTPVLSQTLEGVTLTLDWVFADAQRISFGYSITGLVESSNALNSSGKITVKDGQGNAISEGGEGVQQVERQPGTITGTWSKVMRTPLSQSDASLSIDIEVTLDDGSGGAEFARPPGSTALPPDVVPTTLPNRHIGPFHFDVLIPVYPQQVFAPKQTATAKGITMRLEKAEITPSYARFILCYPKPSVKDWMLGRKTTLQAGAVQAQYSSYTLLADSDYGGYMSNPPQPTDIPAVANSERCVLIDFLLGHSDLPQSLILTIPTLEQSVPEVIPDAALKAAQEKLKEQGIEVEYVNIPVQGGGGGGGYRITKKPEWMDDEEAFERFYAALGYYFSGPWIFTIPTRPQTSAPIALVETALPPPPGSLPTSSPTASASDLVDYQPSAFPGSLPEGLEMDIYRMKQRPDSERLNFVQMFETLKEQSRFSRFPQGRYFWITYTMADIRKKNRALAPFGYRLDFQYNENGDNFTNLYQGDKLVFESISTYGDVSINQTGTDFMLQVETLGSHYGHYIIHANAIEELKNVGGGFYNLHPQYLGDEKMYTETTYEHFPTPLSQETPQALPNTEVVTVFRGGQAIYKTSTPVRAAVSGYIGFWTYGSHWALEVIDQITIDGQPINQQLGYDKSYEFHLLNQKPMFFFEKDGKLGLYMDGREIPLPWQSIPHYGCCSAAALNPVQFSSLLFFFGQQGERWDYVEVEAAQ